MLWMLQDAEQAGGEIESQVADGGEAAGSSLNLTDGVSSDEMMSI